MKKYRVTNETRSYTFFTDSFECAQNYIDDNTFDIISARRADNDALVNQSVAYWMREREPRRWQE